MTASATPPMAPTTMQAKVISIVLATPMSV